MIVFKDDAKFQLVRDRTYLLNFTTFEDKFFFWMQVFIYFILFVKNL